MAQIPNTSNQGDRDESEDGGGVMGGELGIASVIGFVKNRYNLEKSFLKLYLKADPCLIL
jgi:hypothetical protein